MPVYSLRLFILNLPSMKNLTVSYSIDNFEQVAQKLCNELGFEWKDNHFKIRKEVGDGIVEAYTFPHFSVMLSRFKLNYDVKVCRFSDPLEGSLTFDFILNGLSQRFQNQANQRINQLIFGTYISTPITESYGLFAKNVYHEHYCIQMEKAWLESFLNRELPEILQETEKPLMIYSAISQQLLPSLVSLIQSQANTPLRQQYLYSKTLEIIISLLDAFMLNGEIYSRQPYPPEDLDLILQVATFIQQNIETHNSIELLSEKFGMNRNKMQAMFKGIYGKTIAEYSRYLRMNYAFQLIMERHSVGEVGHRLGYSNLSHFSAAFKKVHGLNPSELLKPGEELQN